MSVATGSMLFSVADILQKRRRLLLVVAFISVDLWLLMFGSQMLQTHRADITTRIHTLKASQARSSIQSGDLATDDMLASLDRGIDAMEIGTLRTIVATADGVVEAERDVQHAALTTRQVLSTVGGATVRTARLLVTTALQLSGRVVLFTARVAAFPFVATGHGIKYVVGAVGGATNSSLASVIQPQNEIGDVPIITPEQAHQATLIQEDTLAVTPIKPTGSGGACDNGAGNGGYPMEWCDARMDTIRTVSYSSDRINRECTSYAYWYFTTVEGYSDFHVTGNANRWARTSNYPTHTTPTEGAIAVETTGAYGHVAIVQALPGQTYEGAVVPEGYVLVSEMNYDWQGHFRYSYSPLSKFSAYIYPNPL